MALRFRCEQCGKRLQVDQPPGARVLCPYCRHAVVVPADARESGASDVPESPSRRHGRGGVTADEGLVATAAMYLPSWGTSVVLHLALVLVALMATWVAVARPQELDLAADVYRPAKPNLKPPSERPEGTRSIHPAKEAPRTQFPFLHPERVTGDVAENNLPAVELIGLGGGGDRFGGVGGFTGTRGDGPNGTGGWFPPARDNRRIVFVIDRSGSMTDTIMYVKWELKRCLRHLKPHQQFHVIFYSTGPALEMPNRKLVPAIDPNRVAAYDFIDHIIPVGGTDPSDALKAAFALKPDVINLLSDGEFAPEVVGLIDRLNAKREVKVNTVCFIYTPGAHILMDIAQRNSGSYRYVGEEDLDALGR